VTGQEEAKELTSRTSLLTGIAVLLPGIRYLSLGVWLSWAFLAYSGATWLSDTEVDGGPLARMYIMSTSANAAILLLSPFFFRRFKFIKASRFSVLGAGLIASLGGLAIIFAGPFYLSSRPLFWLGSIMTGVGTAVISLKIGWLYSALQPWRALVYSLFSQIILVAIFFFVLGNKGFCPIAGGPTISGILALVFLPLLAALISTIQPDNHSNLDIGGSSEDQCPRPGGLTGNQDKGRQIDDRQQITSLPPVFWKFLLAVFIFTLSTSVVRGYFIGFSPPAAIMTNSSSLMSFRFFFIIALLLLTIRFFRHVSFGKPYLFFMVAVAIIVALMPLLQVYNSTFIRIIQFSTSIFDLLAWCLMAFITFEKRISPTIVFGFGRGIFMAGSALGWYVGARVMPLVIVGNFQAPLYIIMAFLIMACATLVFTEKDFDKLFSPFSGFELNLSGTLQAADGQHDDSAMSEKRRPYINACKQVAYRARLSTREQGILELLALGFGNETIARRLDIAVNTVRTHTQNIYMKLNVHSRQELIALIEEERDQIRDS
jgi:DNA-binding CsgD family transcriptional regulator